MRKHLQRTLFASIVIVSLTCSFLFVGKAQVTNVYKVVDALRHPFPDLRLVAAHRGLWGLKNPNNLPENSIRAVQNAADNGFEMAEIDLKETQDGTVILMHDWNLGRTTNIGSYCSDITHNIAECSGNMQFDPYQNVGFNPPAKTISLQTLEKFHVLLRRQDFTFSPDSPDGLPTLDQLMQALSTSKPIVLLLDIKDAKTTRDAWRIINKYKNSYGTPAYNWVIFKLNATIYPNPGSLELDLGLYYCDETGCWPTVDYDRFLFIPVFTSNMITKINCINTYNSYKDLPFTVTAEVNLKEQYGRNWDVYNAINNQGTAALIFHAVPDAIQKYAPPGQGFYFKNTGAGVYQLKDLLQPPVSRQPNETIDRRYDLDYILNLNFKGMTTDDPIGVSDALKGRGWRNMSHIQDP